MNTTAALAISVLLLSVVTSALTAKRSVSPWDAASSSTSWCQMSKDDHSLQYGVETTWRASRRRRLLLLFQRKDCPCAAVQWSHTVDGKCNHRLDPWMGSAGSPMLVLSGAPKTQKPTGHDRPNPRVISNVVHRSPKGATPNRRKMSELVMYFGQFVDHSIVSTKNSNISMPIRAPNDDDTFVENQTIPFRRTQREDSEGGWAPTNTLTSFIDAASIYSSNAAHLCKLRSFKKGQLRTSSGNMLPFENKFMYLSGDDRANENAGLTAIHTLLFREHNRAAKEVSAAFPWLDDTQIFSIARRLVIAQLQAVVFYDFVPAVLGHPLPTYKGYKRRVDPRVATEFSTAAYRVGHSLVNARISVRNSAGKMTYIPLRRGFHNPQVLTKHGVEDVLRGMFYTRASEIDVYVTEDVRSFLLEAPGDSLRLDLAALNIQRGRDHALPSYNEMRAVYKLPRVRSFSQITSDPTVARRLRSVYRTVDRIDAWTGGMAEDHVPGGSLGPLFHSAWIDQFRRLRDGDRFFFQRRKAFSAIERRKLRTARFLTDPRFRGGAMRRLILYNTNLSAADIPRNPFFAHR